MEKIPQHLLPDPARRSRLRASDERSDRARRPKYMASPTTPQSEQSPANLVNTKRAHLSVLCDGQGSCAEDAACRILSVIVFSIFAGLAGRRRSN
jgi:hypothetical protein